MYLPEHSHCKHCGETTEYGDDYCNEECKRKYDEEVKAEKMKDFKFYGMVAISLIAILLIGVVTYFVRG